METTLTELVKARIDPRLKKFVQDHIEQRRLEVGQYNESDVVREGLLLLKAKEGRRRGGRR